MGYMVYEGEGVWTDVGATPPTGIHLYKAGNELTNRYSSGYVEYLGTIPTLQGSRDISLGGVMDPIGTSLGYASLGRYGSSFNNFQITSGSFLNSPVNCYNIGSFNDSATGLTLEEFKKFKDTGKIDFMPSVGNRVILVDIDTIDNSCMAPGTSIYGNNKLKIKDSYINTNLIPTININLPSNRNAKFEIEGSCFYTDSFIHYYDDIFLKNTYLQATNIPVGLGLEGCDIRGLHVSGPTRLHAKALNCGSLTINPPAISHYWKRFDVYIMPETSLEIPVSLVINVVGNNPDPKLEVEVWVGEVTIIPAVLVKKFVIEFYLAGGTTTPRAYVGGVLDPNNPQTGHTWQHDSNGYTLGINSSAAIGSKINLSKYGIPTNKLHDLGYKGSGSGAILGEKSLDITWDYMPLFSADVGGAIIIANEAEPITDGSSSGGGTPCITQT